MASSGYLLAAGQLKVGGGTNDKWQSEAWKTTGVLCNGWSVKDYPIKKIRGTTVFLNNQVILKVKMVQYVARSNLLDGSSA